MCPEMWVTQVHATAALFLPFVSETLQPVETLQPAQEGAQAAFNVVRLLVIFIIRLLQEKQQPSGRVCVCMCLPNLCR